MSWVNAGSLSRPGRLGAYPQGDPGLFSFLGKAIGTVAKVAGSILPGPVGTIAKFAGNVLVPARKVGAAGAIPSMPVLRPSTAVMPGGALIAAGSGGGVNIGGPKGVTIGSFPAPFAAPQNGNQTQSGGGAAMGQPFQHAACTSGFHYNKHGYFTKRYGYIEPGTVCVRNRKRNPLNPRALSRAMTRVKGARKAINHLVQFERVVSPKGKLKVKRPAKRCA